jgi:hypothetical protein
LIASSIVLSITVVATANKDIGIPSVRGVVMG